VFGVVIRARAGDFLVCVVIPIDRTSHPMASKILKDVTGFLTPAPPVFDDEYDGLEYTWKFFVFRPAREFQPIRSSLNTYTHTHHTPHILILRKILSTEPRIHTSI